MSRLEDLTGQSFGKWTILSRGKTVNGMSKWLCRCDCGTEREIYRANLKNGSSTSCGCGFDREYHGERNSREYGIWSKMHWRCYNPKCSAYDDYGGRGIVVCDAWHKFSKFLEDMGRCPDRRSLERLDNSGNYSKENCIWALPVDQGRNKRNNRLIEFNGRTQCLQAWADETGIYRGTILQRIDNLGWSIEDALSTPSRGWRRFRAL